MNLFKKLVSITLTVALVFSLSSCTSKPKTEEAAKPADQPAKTEGYELALITDLEQLMTNHLIKELGKV